jgi:hypothetical protein
MTPAEVAELSEYAESFSQRFGQFLENVLHTDRVDNVPLFYISDEELMKRARLYYVRYTSETRNPRNPR